MSGLRPVTDAQRLRARRWDAIVLGTGISGLVAAARLGAAGHRVLVVEEDAARAQHPALREPFFMAGARDSGALDACLRALNIPLIDQRRLAPERLAYQVVTPKSRIDIGGPGVTIEELTSWGLCAADEAGALVRAIVDATEAERKVMLASPLVRTGRRLGLPRTTTPGSHVRGLPAEAAAPRAELAEILNAQVSALSNLARAVPGPEARSRLLGTPLAGGVGFGDGPPWLSGLLRRRVEAVYGEFRTLAGRFDLVSFDNQPGIISEGSSELWVGRALLIAAAPSALASVQLQSPVPDFLEVERTRLRRLHVHLRIHRDVIPHGMCARLILTGEGPPDSLTGRVISATAYANPQGGAEVDLVGRIRVADDEDIAEVEAEVLRRIQNLMPFSEGRIALREQRRPLWDDDGWLEDPERGAGWPSEIELRVAGRAPVYRLDRSGVACLGLEGDLLLGWRAGDAIAAELG
jgi:hypothetical protein